MHIKKGDLVKVIAGRDRHLGPARVLKVLPTEGRVIVEGRNLVKKHLRGNQMLGTESRIEEVEAPIHASNVLLWSEKIEKAVRTRMRWVGDGGSLHDSERSALASFSDAPKRLKKVRWSPKSEEIFD